MKKIIRPIISISLFCALAISFTSCTKEDIAPAGIKELKFNIEVNNASAQDTKAVQTDWEDGNRILVFFYVSVGAESGFLDPINYVTLTYNATEKKWNGAVCGSLSDASLLGTSGVMYGVFFPYGDVAVISDGNGGVNFRTSNNTNPALNGMLVSTYYMTAGAPYTVETAGDVATLEGQFDMVLPENFVYFYVSKDGEKYCENEKYRLAIEGVYPVACYSFNKGFKETPQNGKFIGQPMWGYKYGDGIAFSGKIDGTWSTSTSYRFIFFSDGDPAVAKSFNGTLASHGSVRLKSPDAANGWEPAVTTPTTTLINEKKWANWNLGADDVNGIGFYLRWGGLVEPKDHNSESLLPEKMIGSNNLVGDYAIYDAARAYLGASWRMPTISEYESLGSVSSSSWIPVGNTEISVGPTVENGGVYYYPNPTLNNGGWRVVDGSNSIFLPVTGMYQNTKTLKESYSNYTVGCYYSSTCVGKYRRFYYNPSGSPFTTSATPSYIEFGMPVRPIKID